MQQAGQLAATLGTEFPAMVQPRTVSAQDLYLQHRERVFQLCLRLGAGRRAWAEDATQDVFVRLLEELPRLEHPDDLGGWIYRVATNTCLTRLKRDGSVWRKVARLLTAAPRAEASPEHEVQVRHDLAAVLRQLQDLPGQERVVFCMKYLDELPQQEIAGALRLSEGYVSKLLQRARARLEERGWEVPSA